jgi:para-nitrobenzyl esterase
MNLIEMKKTFKKTALLSSFVSIFILVALLLTGVTAIAQGNGGLPETIAIEGGKISGLGLGENKDVMAFKGIPYAKPPVGPLRWKPPEPVEAWEGVLQATEYGPACLQPNLPGMTLKHGKRSEDCLYLNVWTAAKSVDEKRPVMMWIHGGGDIIGDAHIAGFFENDGEALARQGIVVVSINYRLGPFGFFAHPLLSKESEHNVSGNYGLLDQIAALKWIQNNIKAFGGDPGNVTIFGESAGAINVGFLIATPLAKGLFHRAISESGNTFSSFVNRHLREGWYHMEPMEKQGERITKDLGCSEAEDPLAALRALSGEKLLEGSKPGMMPPANTFYPVVDGWVLPDDVMTIFDQGKQNAVPLLAGTNADEGSLFNPQPFPSVDAYRGFLKAVYGPFADAVFAMYPAKEPSETLKARRDIMADSAFIAPTRRLVQAMSKSGGNAYVYHFTMTGVGPTAALGAFHSGEIVYAFNDIERVKNMFKAPFEEKHQALATTMSAYWVQFAKTGNPNKEGLVEWPAYDAAKDQYIELGEVVKVGQGLRKERLDFWDNLEAQARKNR